MKAKIGQRLLASDKTRPRAKPFQIHDTSLKGFILRIQPSGAMTFYFEYKPASGKRNRIKIGTTLETNATVARDRALSLSADVIKGVDPAVVKREARTNACTLEDYLEQHYAPWALSEQRFRTGAKTVARIRSVFEEFLKRPISDPAFAWCIEKYRTSRLKAGIKKATLDRDVGSLKALFSHATRNSEIKLATNPLAGVKPLRRQGDDDEGDERIRYLGQRDCHEPERFWTAIFNREARLRAERRRYNEWLRARGLVEYPDLDLVPYADYLRPMIELAMNTGLRRKELFLSEWESFKPDLAEPVLMVPGKISKSKRTRHVALNQAALQVLLAWQRQTNGTSGLIFPARDGKARDNTKRAWKSLLVHAGIEDFRWHDMRHDFASRLVMAGVDLNMVRELLGHRDLKTTLRYAHLSPSTKSRAVARLDSAQADLKIDQVAVHA